MPHWISDEDLQYARERIGDFLDSGLGAASSADPNAANRSAQLLFGVECLARWLQLPIIDEAARASDRIEAAIATALKHRRTPS